MLTPNSAICLDRLTHLSEQVCQLCVDLGPKGGARNINEGFSVHFLGHFQLLQNS